MFTMQSFSSGRMSAGVSPTGGRYLEDGLVVPGKHLVSPRDKQLITSRETDAHELSCHRKHDKKKLGLLD